MFKRYVRSKRHTMQVDFDDWMLATRRERKRAAAGAGPRAAPLPCRRPRRRRGDHRLRGPRRSAGQLEASAATRRRPPPRGRRGVGRGRRGRARAAAPPRPRGRRGPRAEVDGSSRPATVFRARPRVRAGSGTGRSRPADPACPTTEVEAPRRRSSLGPVGLAAASRVAARRAPADVGRRRSPVARRAGPRATGCAARRQRRPRGCGTVPDGDRRRPQAVLARGDLPEHRHVRAAAPYRDRGDGAGARRVAPRPHAVRALGRVGGPRPPRVRRARPRGSRRRRGRRHGLPRSPGSSPPRCPTALACSPSRATSPACCSPSSRRRRAAWRWSSCRSSGSRKPWRRSTTSSRSPPCRAPTAGSPTSTRSWPRPPRTTSGRSPTRRRGRGGTTSTTARFDYTACAGYKWLLAPRGTAYFTLRPEHRDSLLPHGAGWYAGDDVPASYYGAPLRLAATRGASTSRRPGTAGSGRRPRGSCSRSSAPARSARTTWRWPPAARGGSG